MAGGSLADLNYWRWAGRNWPHSTFTGPPPDVAIGEGTFSLVVGDFLFRRSLDFYHRR